MNCNRPYLVNGNAHGCGQCIPCRVNKRREWTHRMILEAAQYKDNAFVTLTYSEEAIPDDLSVSPQELSKFIKRLRKPGNKFRYFACGEYGTDTMRPHYHIALFGFPTCSYSLTRKKPYCCAICESISRAWGHGQIMVGTLEPKAMAYVAGYVTKKMTRDDDPRLEGRRPEFARMSLKPGIGYGMMHDLASTLMQYDLDKLVDVPMALQHGKVKMPLGRYLRRSLRKLIGREANAPKEVMDALAEKMRPLREAAFANSSPFSAAVLASTEGKRIQIEARHRRNRKAIKL